MYVYNQSTVRTICNNSIIPQGPISPLISNIITLPPATSPAPSVSSSSPPSCSQCCIPAAVIHSGSYLLCILWSHSPCAGLSLLPCLFASPPVTLSVFHCLPRIITHILFCTFVLSQRFYHRCSPSLSFFPIGEPLRSPFTRSRLLMPRLRLMNHCQALPSKLCASMCVCVYAPCAGIGKQWMSRMSSSQAEGTRAVRWELLMCLWRCLWVSCWGG